MNVAGDIELTLISAKLFNDTDFLCKMDPFCEIKMGNKTQRSKTASSQGQTPHWNQKFLLRLNPDDQIIYFIIWDYDLLTKNDFLGQGCLSVSSLPLGQKAHTIPLYRKGVYAGELTLMTNVIPAGTYYVQPQQQLQQNYSNNNNTNLWDNLKTKAKDVAQEVKNIIYKDKTNQYQQPNQYYR